MAWGSLCRGLHRIRATEPMTFPFVVLTTQRTGSTWLVDQLASHPDLRCHGELFLEGGIGEPPFGSRGVAFFEDVASSRSGMGVDDYLDALLVPADVKAVGMKLMYGQAGAYPAVLGWLEARGGRILHLVRANVLDMHISRVVAWERDLYHAREGMRPSPARVTLEVRSLVGALDRIEARRQRAREQLAVLGLAVHDLTYEDMVLSGEALIEVQRFLDVPPVALRSGLRKLISRPREQVVANFAEVRAALKGTAHEWTLDDQRAEPV